MSGQGTADVFAETGLILALAVCFQISPSSGAHNPTDRAATGTDSARQHLDNATVLERLGLLKESEAQYLSAMASEDPDVRQQAEVGLARAHKEEQQQLARTDTEIAKALEESHQLDQALTAYERAFRNGKGADRDAAQQSILRVLRARESFWERYVRGWAWPWLVKFGISVVGLVALYLFLKLLYRMLRVLGQWRGSASRRIEIADFEDTTDTGLGKGFPALLRTTYWERQLLAQPAPASLGGVAVAFHPSEWDLPVMGSADYETFSEIDLELAGIKVSELLGRVERLILQPRYRIGGVIYRGGNEVRSAVSLSKYNKAEMSRWDFVLALQDGAVPTLSDPIYEIIDFVLKDWRSRV